MKEGVCNGEYQLVCFTPEILLGGKKWRKLLVGDVYSSKFHVVVIDEAHTVVKWSVV